MLVIGKMLDAWHTKYGFKEGLYYLNNGVGNLAMDVLNKYIAHAGVCSRRAAGIRIKGGEIKVNDTIVTDPSYRVKQGDVIKVSGLVINPEDKVYILLNKPKDYVTTMCDERGRRTVLDLIKDATRARVYPVGRLDRNTTGLLLLTNDGQLAQQLAHPSHEVYKIYHVRLHKRLQPVHLQAIKQGLTLEDGLVTVDDIAVVTGSSGSELGITLHSGKNRVIRRIFEHLGYQIKKLDRIAYAGLTKQGISLGSWRYLHSEEIARLRGI